MNLNSLLKPKSIAIIGANESDGFAGAVCKSIEAYMENTDKVYYVNPNRENLRNKKCYKNVNDIEYEVDLLVIATNKNTVLPVLREGQKKGIKAAVVFASGFSECEDGTELEKDLIKFANETGILIMGPNCAGFCNYIDNIPLYAFLSEKRDRKGHIGIISQSGMIGLSIIDNQMMKMSYNISCGNANIIKFTDYMDFLIEDKDTDIIGIYVDGIKDIDDFELCLKKAYQNDKKIVLLKMGKTEKSKLLSQNHTGTIENFDENVFAKMVNEYSVYQVDDLEEFIYTLLLLEYTKGVENVNGIASINLSGGEANIATEIGEKYNINFPVFSDNVCRYLKERLPSYAHITNPLDMTVTLSYDACAFADAIDVIMNEEKIDMVLIGYTLLRKIDDPCIEYMIKAIKMLKERRKDRMKPIAIMSFFSCTRHQESIEELIKIGVVVLPTPIYAYTIIKNLCKNLKN